MLTTFETNLEMYMKIKKYLLQIYAWYKDKYTIAVLSIY